MIIKFSFFYILKGREIRDLHKHCFSVLILVNTFLYVTATKGNAQSETGHCPMWKCYVKKDVTADHLLITFVPASYDDLLLLNQVTRAVTSQEDVSSDNFSHHPVSCDSYIDIVVLVISSMLCILLVKSGHLLNSL